LGLSQLTEIMIILSILLILISVFLPKKLKVFDLVKNHFLSFYNDKKATKSVDWAEIVLIYVLPMFSSIILINIANVDLSLIKNDLLSIVAIFIGFLLTSLSILVSIDSSNKDMIYNKLALETVNSIGYEIIHAILLMLLIVSDHYISTELANIFDIITLYLLITLFLVLIMIIKRIFSINKFQLKTSNANKEIDGKDQN